MPDQVQQAAAASLECIAHQKVEYGRSVPHILGTPGIRVPDDLRDKRAGKTLVGPGARNKQGRIVALEMNAGDRILFGKWSGTELKLDGEKPLIVQEYGIMGIIDGSPAIRKHIQTAPSISGKIEQMGAKNARFGDDARQHMLGGADILAQAVKIPSVRRAVI